MEKQIKITDFKFLKTGAGHYSLSYFSPKTGKEFKRPVTDMDVVDEFKNTETHDHTQIRLKWLKSYIKKY